MFIWFAMTWGKVATWDYVFCKSAEVLSCSGANQFCHCRIGSDRIVMLSIAILSVHMLHVHIHCSVFSFTNNRTRWIASSSIAPMHFTVGVCLFFFFFSSNERHDFPFPVSFIALPPKAFLPISVFFKHTFWKCIFKAHFNIDWW